MDRLNALLPWKRKPSADSVSAEDNQPGSDNLPVDGESEAAAAKPAGGQAPRSALPYLPDPFFSGRAGELADLEARLCAGPTKPGPVILVGSEGMGKTALASAFCHRSGSRFARIDWLAAGSSAEYQEGAAILPALAAPPSTALPWLVVVDALEEPRALLPWLETLPGARVLVTSRRETWPPEAGAQLLRIGPMNEEESLALLRKAMAQPNRAAALFEKVAPGLAKDPTAGLEELAGMFQGLPLALRLAAACLTARSRRTALGLKAEIEQAAETYSDPLVDWTRDFPTAARANIDRLYHLLQHELDGKAQRAARRLFSSACFCAPGEPILAELLEAALIEGEGKPMGSLKNGLEKLYELGLLHPGPRGPLISPVLAGLGRQVEGCDGACLEPLARAASELAIAASQTGQEPPPGGLWLHVRALAHHARDEHLEAAGALWNLLGYAWWAVKQYEYARLCVERGLAVEEHVYGKEHAEVSTTVSNLGRILYDLGDLPAAREAFARALAIDEKFYSDVYPGVASDAENLALVLLDMGQLREARGLFERALRIHENAYGYGPRHPAVAKDAANLGRVHRMLGDLPRARAYYERALEVDEWINGPSSPQITANLSSLGRVLFDLRETHAAIEHFERLLVIQESAYGESHAELAPTLNHLGLALQDAGSLTRARACFERALEIDERTYPPAHPSIARDTNNLGSVLRDLGSLAEARVSFERALRINEQIYGAEHANVATSANNLARVLYSLGERQEARACFRRVLAIDERVYGLHHLDVASDLNNLGIIASDLLEYPEAKALFERALAIFEQKLPADHPKLLKARKYYERVKRKMGQAGK